MAAVPQWGQVATGHCPCHQKMHVHTACGSQAAHLSTRTAAEGNGSPGAMTLQLDGVLSLSWGIWDRSGRGCWHLGWHPQMDGNRTTPAHPYPQGPGPTIMHPKHGSLHCGPDTLRNFVEHSWEDLIFIVSAPTNSGLPFWVQNNLKSKKLLLKWGIWVTKCMWVPTLLNDWLMDSAPTCRTARTSKHSLVDQLPSCAQVILGLLS